MIDNYDYPLHDEEHEILPTGLRVKNTCSVCKEGHPLISQFGYRVYILNNKLCLEGPDGICCSEVLTTCPKCGRSLQNTCGSSKEYWNVYLGIL